MTENYAYFVVRLFVLSLSLCLCSVGWSQCAGPTAVVAVNVVPDGSGNCTFNISVSYTNPSGGGNSSIEVDIVTSGGTSLVTGDCINNISGPGTKTYGPFTGISCAESVDVNWRGRTNPTCGGSQCNSGTMSTPPLVLPVELISFTAQGDLNGVVLHWSTATEENNDYFAVEHSIDGAHFVEIGRVEGMGTTSEIQYYGFVHRTPINGRNYYRLRQTDFDEDSYEYSPIAVVKLGSVLGSVKVHPTNTADIVNLHFSKRPGKNIVVTLVSRVGEILESKSLTEDDYQLQFDLSNHAPGMYFLTMYDFILQEKIARPVIKLE